jgi:hypothetical protein
MATQMHPEHASRVFGAATNEEMREQLRSLDVEFLTDGHIGGLNGVLLAAAAESGLPGACLLGEMPHIFSQLPFPKASLAILEAFTNLAGIELDLTELGERSKAVEQQLGELLAQVERSLEHERSAEDEGYRLEPAEEPGLKPADAQRIEALLKQAQNDRSKAFELKQELDRLGVFKDYEDRFLDLFKKAE